MAHFKKDNYQDETLTYCSNVLQQQSDGFLTKFVDDKETLKYL